MPNPVPVLRLRDGSSPELEKARPSSFVSERRVTKTRQEGGDIVALCHEGASWSPRSKADAIRDIESGVHTYYVLWTDGTTDIHVVDGPQGKYLRTDKDTTARNNLDDLPDC